MSWATSLSKVTHQLQIPTLSVIFSNSAPLIEKFKIWDLVKKSIFAFWFGGKPLLMLCSYCDGQAPGFWVLEEDSERSSLRGGAHGGPEWAGLAPAEPQAWRSALLHPHAACSGVCSGRQLQAREPLQWGVRRGQASHRTGEDPCVYWHVLPSQGVCLKTGIFSSFVPMIQRCSFRRLCWPRTAVMLSTSTWAVHRWSLREVRTVVPRKTNLNVSEETSDRNINLVSKGTMGFSYKTNGSCWRKWVSLF